MFFNRPEVKKLQKHVKKGEDPAVYLTPHGVSLVEQLLEQFPG